MIKDIRNFILEEELEIRIYKNKVNVVNYTKIGYFDKNKVIIYSTDKKIIITGDDIIVSKLMSDEILISGSIKNIEFRNANE